MIDFQAKPGVGMMDSKCYNREKDYVQSKKDKNRVPPGLFPMAVACDNNGVRPTMGITPGTLHISFIGATTVGILPGQAPLPRLSARKGSLPPKNVTVNMVVKGKARDNEALTFERFESNVFLGTWRAWDRRYDHSQPIACFEFEIRQVRILW